MDKKARSGNPSLPAPGTLGFAPNPLPGCPMAAAFAAVGGKWKLTLVYWLAHGETHFAGLRHRAAPISAKVLAEQLRELQADGLVDRVETGPVPAPVVYRLTAYGRDRPPDGRERAGLGRCATCVTPARPASRPGSRLRRRGRLTENG